MCDLVALKKDVSIVKNERSLLQNYKKHKKKRMRIFVFYDKEKVHARTRAERKEKVQAHVQAEQKEKKNKKTKSITTICDNDVERIIITFGRCDIDRQTSTVIVDNDGCDPLYILLIILSSCCW